MTDTTATEPPVLVDNEVPVAEATPAAVPPTKPAPKPRTASTDAKEAKAKDTLTCAGCGKKVTKLTEKTTIGTEMLVYHDCDAMRQLVHNYFVGRLNDPSLEAPSVTK